MRFFNIFQNKNYFLSALLGVCLMAAWPAYAQDNPEVESSSKIRLLNDELSKGSRSDQKWKWTEETGLQAVSIRHVSAAFWVAKDKLSYDGTLRFRLKVGKRPDSSVFFRSSFPDAPSKVTGYSVSFDRHYIELHRWDNGYPQMIGSRKKISSLPEVYEVFISMKGTIMQIDVQDGKSHQSLKKFTLNDARYHGLETGYRVHRKQDGKSSLLGYDFKASSTQSEPIEMHPDAYLGQQTSAWLFVPSNKVKATSGLKSCKRVANAGIENYHVYKCSHSTMLSLVDSNRRLPNGYFWSESRNAFEDSEYRKTALDLNCEIPMHCDASKRLDPNRSAKDADMVEAYLDEYMKVCKNKIRHVRLETIGHSYLGHPIRALVLSNADNPNSASKVLFNGAHHGMELLATDMTFDIMEQLCESDERKNYDDVLKNVEVWLIPLVNYDGNDLFFHVSNHLGRKNGRFVFSSLRKKNPFPKKTGSKTSRSAYYLYHPNNVAAAAGVDINRNYPLHWGATGEKASSGNPRHYWYRGTAPGSEPEIQSMMNLFHTEQFAASISFHTVSTRILSPYSIDALVNPPHEEDNAWQLALKMAEAAGVQTSGKPYEVVKNLYSVDGTDQDWFRMLSGTYAYLIEGSLHNPTGEKRRDALLKTRPTWEVFLTAVQQAVRVSVRDREGNPLMAEVRYSGEPHLNNEKWLTRYDGTHTMLCFADQNITVTIADGTSQTKSVQCQQNRMTGVEFVFDHPVNDDPFLLMDEKYRSLMGIDALCDMQNHMAPHLPANRYCYIDGKCISAGQKSSEKSRYHCDPIENNRGWTK